MSNLRKFSACLLALLLLVGLLPTVAMAANSQPGDYYILITRDGDDAKYYGVGKNDAVVYFEPGTYHVEVFWTFRGDDEVQTAENVYLSIERDQTCQANSAGHISATIMSDNAGMATSHLCFFTFSSINIYSVPGSIKLYSDGSEYGPDVDAENITVTESYNSIGNLADGQSCRLEYDIKVTEIVSTPGPETSGMPEASEPVTSAAPVENDPRLPEVFDGAVVTNYRTMYTSENRPDGVMLNAISDDPNWGNELYFLHLIDLETGEEFRQGIVKLVPGRAYRVEVVAHNAAKQYVYRTATGATLTVEMTHGLPGGSLGLLGATVSAENAVPVAVSATLGLYCEASVRLQFMSDSASFQASIDTTGEQLDYKALFTDGALLGNGNLAGGGAGGSATFVIRAVADETIPLATGEERLEDPVFATPYVQLKAAPGADDEPQPTETNQPADDKNTNDVQQTNGEPEDTQGFNFWPVIVVGAMICAVVIVLRKDDPNNKPEEGEGDPK